MAVAILRLPNRLDLSIDVGDTTPPNGLNTPSSSVTNFGHLEHSIASNNSRKDLLQSQANGTAANIMHADSYLNIYKLPSNNSNCKLADLLIFSYFLFNAMEFQ